MDLSGKYVRMCKEAEEIQRTWEPRVGDFFARYYTLHNPGWSVSIIEGEHLFILENMSNRNIYVWLPRQDQLQRMVNWPQDISCVGKLTLLISEVSRIYPFDELKSFDTLEQLWLAFVMWAKYGKVWDEEKRIWIKPKLEVVS